MERRGCGWLRTAAGGLRSETGRPGGCEEEVAVFLLLSVYIDQRTAGVWVLGRGAGPGFHYSGELLDWSTWIFSGGDTFVVRSA